MTSHPKSIATTHSFSSRRLPETKRVGALKDMFERSVHLEITAAARRPVDMTVRQMPGLRRAEMRSALTARTARPRAMLADQEDTVCLMIKSAGHLRLAQRGGTCVPDCGDGALLVYREPATIEFEDARYLSLRVPFQALSALVDVEAAAGRLIPRHTEALALLQAYVACLPNAFDDAAAADLSTRHVHDLMALAIGATGRAREGAIQHSVRVARRRAIEADLNRDCDVSIEQLARQHGITPRYIQMLLSEIDTTFTDAVRALKLEKARRMLISPSHAEQSIASIAFDAGFGDVSTFNRSFKQRYGATPSDLRAARRSGST